MRFLFPLLLVVQPLAAADLEADFQRFLAWFPGEYNNHEQVWQARSAGVEPHEHLHHIFAPVSVPGLGEHVFYVQQHMDADPDNIYRQRLYLFEKNAERGAIQLTIFSFPDDPAVRDAHRDPTKVAGFTRAELRSIPGCEVYWTWNGEYFDGRMDEGACSFISPRLGKRITITDDLKLTAEEIWIRDVARDEDGNLVFGNPEREHHKNRRVQYYAGWVAIKRAGSEAAPEDRDWIGMRGLRLHSEGDGIAVVAEDGTPMGVRVQLARLTHRNSAVPVLTLRVLDEESGRLLAYAWGEPGAERLGLNIGWLQAGFTREAAPGAVASD